MISFNNLSRKNTIEETLKKLNNEESSVSDNTLQESENEEKFKTEVPNRRKRKEPINKVRISQMNTHESNKSIK